MASYHRHNINYANLHISYSTIMMVKHKNNAHKYDILYIMLPIYTRFGRAGSWNANIDGTLNVQHVRKVFFKSSDKGTIKEALHSISHTIFTTMTIDWLVWGPSERRTPMPSCLTQPQISIQWCRWVHSSIFSHLKAINCWKTPLLKFRSYLCNLVKYHKLGQSLSVSDFPRYPVPGVIWSCAL